MAVDSVVVAIDGDAKCGKTATIESIATEAEYQAGIVPNLLNSTDIDKLLLPVDKEQLASMHENYKFNHIVTIPAGNAFRAATLYVALNELRGVTETELSTNDAKEVRQLLDLEGIEQTLQHDPNIAGKVADVSKLAGAQALCGTIFCETVASAMTADGGGNLVIVDARDPIGHMRRNNLIGFGANQVKPKNIIPIYIDTPAEVAAARMAGDYDANLAAIRHRRHVDATRDELPVRRPELFMGNFSEWLRQFISELGYKELPPEVRELVRPIPDSEVAKPLRVVNGEEVDLSNIQYLAGVVASLAQNLAIISQAEKARLNKHYTTTG